MPSLITPADLTRRSDLFYQLAQFTAAGVGVIDAIETIHRSPPQRWMRAPLARMLSSLHEGSTFTDALARSGRWLSGFDVALLHAGEQSGRLPQCFKLLAEYYAQRAQLVRQVIGFVLYPLVVFHVAVALFPLGRFTDLVLKGAVVPYVAQKFAVLVPVYGLALFLWWGLQSTHGHGWRAGVERILSFVPVLGTARRNLAIARLSIALEALLNAGVTVIEAWELAAAASGSPTLQRVVSMSKPGLLAGKTPAEMVRSHREFPTTFAGLYSFGELSGQLDDALRRTHVLFEEEGSRKMKQFVFGTAGALIGGVMLFAAVGIIRSWMGYFQQVNDAINMAQ